MKHLKPLIAGIALIGFASCAPKQDNSSSYNSSQETTSSDVDVVTSAATDKTGTVSSSATVPADSSKWIQSGSLEMKVSSVDSFTRSISAYVKSVGGMITHQDVAYEHEREHTIDLNSTTRQVITTVKPHAEITVRIPASQLENFIFRATDFSVYPIRSTLHLEDKTLEYVYNRMTSENRAAELQKNPGGNKAFNQYERLEQADRQVEKTIANMRINNDVQYSVVHIVASQNPLTIRENMVYEDASTYRSPASVRFGEALSVGLRAFSDLFFALLRLWAFLLIGAIVYILVKRHRKRQAAKAHTPEDQT